MRIIALLLIASFSFVHAYEGGCGTMQVLQNIINKRKQPRLASIKFDYERCSYEQYYDSVYTIETPHIQVLYVLNGPHATTKAFAESTAKSMEEAWNYYVNKLKMRAPKGPSVSHHYQHEIKEGLYPIEIIDVDQIRDPDGSYTCNACFALTIPLDDPTTSQIFLDNDFYYGAWDNYNKEEITVNGTTCSYAKGYIPLRNNAHNFSYADEWAKGIRLTVFHEFYHAIQLQYLNVIMDNHLFWFEASATGFEEITNSDIDDYFSYIPSLFRDMGEPLSKINQNNSHKIYGVSTFFLYLFNRVGNDFDRSIWESFSKNPTKPFEYQFETSLKPYHLDADSVFHDYTVRLSLSGSKSKSISKKEWIVDDQPEWPSALFYDQDSIKPELESLAFKFYRTSNNYIEPDFTDFIGKASVITFNNGTASIYTIQNTKTLDSLSSVLITSDSTLWIFSRLGDSEAIPLVNKDAAPHAYPVPWRQGPLCFAPLPHDKKFIEIRTRRGDLVSQEKYLSNKYCLSEDKVKSMMAPGVYRFRVGNKGKTTSFMVMY